MLREIQTLAYDYGQDVLFLTIAVDPNQSDIKSYIKKYDLALPTLLNDNTDRTYDLQGVPMLYVIDKTGHIRYEHKGFRPDMQEVVAIELEDLLGE